MPEGDLEQVLDFTKDVLKALKSDNEVLKSVLTCEVCCSLIVNPFVLSCGHSFCGGCLVQWFQQVEDNQSCPGCRQKVNSKPSYNYALSKIVRCVINSWNQQHPDKKVDVDDRKTEYDSLLKEPNQRPRPIYSEEDGMYMCGVCLHEIDTQGYCSNPSCETFYEELASQSANNSDDDMDDLEEGNGDDIASEASYHTSSDGSEFWIGDVGSIAFYPPRFDNALDFLFENIKGSRDTHMSIFDVIDEIRTYIKPNSTDGSRTPEPDLGIRKILLETSERSRHGSRPSRFYYCPEDDPNADEDEIGTFEELFEQVAERPDVVSRITLFGCQEQGTAHQPVVIYKRQRNPELDMYEDEFDYDDGFVVDDDESEASYASYVGDDLEDGDLQFKNMSSISPSSDSDVIEILD